MWYLGQTIRYLKKNIPVVLLGYENQCSTDEKNPFRVVTKDKDGNIIKASSIKQFTHYEDDKGKCLPGKSIIGDFFGLIKPKYWKKFSPDLDVLDNSIK